MLRQKAVLVLESGGFDVSGSFLSVVFFRPPSLIRFVRQTPVIPSHGHTWLDRTLRDIQSPREFPRHHIELARRNSKVTCFLAISFEEGPNSEPKPPLPARIGQPTRGHREMLDLTATRAVDRTG